MRLFLVVFAGLLASTTTMAATPILSGPYVFTWTKQCAVKGMVGSFSLTQQNGILTFDSANGTVTGGGYKTTGEPPTVGSWSGNTTYSNTPNQLTIVGLGTSHAFYGGLDNGVATYVSILGAVGTGCAAQGTLVLQ